MARPQRSDARRNRDRLLAVAAEALEERGADVPLEEIARRAGVGIGTLYRHFPTRDALLEAVFRHNVDQLCSGGLELLDTLPPEEALAEWMQRLVAYVAAKKGLAGYLKTVVSADSDLFASSHERINATVRTLVDAAVAAGSVRPDVDPEDLLRALFGVCLMADQPGWQDQACRISGLLMDGMRYRPQPAPATAPARSRRTARRA